MSDFDFEDDEYGTDNGGDNLVNRLRRQLRESEKARKELDSQVKQLAQSTRSATLHNLLASKQVNPKLATVIPADVEATEQGITQWLAEYADVFNVAQTAPEPPSEPQVQPQPQQGFAPTADDAVVRAFLAAQSGIQAAQVNSIPAATTEASAQSALLAKAGEAKSADGFFASLRNGG